MTTYICTLYYPPHLLPHCGSRGFGSEDNSGREVKTGNIEYIFMQSLINHLHSLSLFSSPSLFCFLLHILEYLPTRIYASMYGVYVCVCSYRCTLLARWGLAARQEHGWKPRMGLSDGNPSYGFVTCFTASQLRLGRPLELVSHLSGCTRV